MNVADFALWLKFHNHHAIVIESEQRVSSTYNGKPRAFELVEAERSPGDDSLFGDDIERSAYWKRVQS